MDVFKLAFETTIVGLLTFIWLALAAYFLFPDFLKDLLARMDSNVVKDYQAAIGVGILILAYCLGSAILPISNQLVNDEHSPLNQDGIRCQVFVKQERDLKDVSLLSKDEISLLSKFEPCRCSHWAPLFPKDENNPACQKEQTKPFRNLVAPLPWESSKNMAPDSDESNRERILTLFQQQETAVLNQISDKTERLRQLHERIVVLRGAVFSLFVLFLISVSAYFARIQGDQAHWGKSIIGGVLGLTFAILAILNAWQDFKNRNVFDIPVLEFVLLVIIIFGFILVIKGIKTPIFRAKRYMFIAIFFTGLTYGGWMWSEILYDQQVISSFSVLPKDAETMKPTPTP